MSTSGGYDAIRYGRAGVWDGLHIGVQGSRYPAIEPTVNQADSRPRPGRQTATFNHPLRAAIRRGRCVAWDGRFATVFTPPDHAWELDLIEQGEQGAWALWVNGNRGRNGYVVASKRTTRAATRRRATRTTAKVPAESAYARVYRRALARRSTPHSDQAPTS